MPSPNDEVHTIISAFDLSLLVDHSIWYECSFLFSFGMVRVDVIFCQSAALLKIIHLFTVYFGFAVNYNAKKFLNSILFFIASWAKCMSRIYTSLKLPNLSTEYQKLVLEHDCLIVPVLSFITNFGVMYLYMKVKQVLVIATIGTDTPAGLICSFKHPSSDWNEFHCRNGEVRPRLLVSIAFHCINDLHQNCNRETLLFMDWNWQSAHL